MKQILVTGGAGYIGSHTVVALYEAGFQPIIVDNLSNSKVVVIDRIEQITGQRPIFYQFDLRDGAQLDQLFKRHNIDAVIHFAGLKAVGESVEQPLRYYQCNLEGALSLFHVMAKHACHRLVFSSSASVYGDPVAVPIPETAPLQPTNPYARSKRMIEEFLGDLCVASPEWSVSLLRYFNPVAAHPSGLIGEDPNGPPNNLLPYIAQVGVGRREFVSVFGDDYDTRDGTGVRDYIHVLDLVEAHIKALAFIKHEPGCHIHNVGTGIGYSVLEMIAAFEIASGVAIPYRMESRRAGDVATCFADPSLSKTQLAWEARHDLAAMMRDHWRWQSENPAGYV
ncbi:UDP-glucose 4-epimerase GalE [Arenicella xantha]|uniref:UDP-glucose 4-epimerase n=1 Tax=Arenicella xantha TaxID=644221 RepID=A0A395JGM5_9GAMM|nr:UDP-glucose 4-epimerase GalE [Arenicella xantha]RBP48891.1 UDP-galactose 4-epimerase [Arenicella xantha]